MASCGAVRRWTLTGRAGAFLEPAAASCSHCDSGCIYRLFHKIRNLLLNESRQLSGQTGCLTWLLRRGHKKSGIAPLRFSLPAILVTIFSRRLIFPTEHAANKNETSRTGKGQRPRAVLTRRV